MALHVFLGKLLLAFRVFSHALDLNFVPESLLIAVYFIPIFIQIYSYKLIPLQMNRFKSQGVTVYCIIYTYLCKNIHTYSWFLLRKHTGANRWMNLNGWSCTPIMVWMYSKENMHPHMKFVSKATRFMEVRISEFGDQLWSISENGNNFHTRIDFDTLLVHWFHEWTPCQSTPSGFWS